MIEYIVYIAYMLSCILFIMGIKKMGKTPTARKGNAYSMYGMLLAVVATLLSPELMETWTSELMANGYLLCAVAVIIGSAIGIYLAKTVKMTGMPEMVASFNGLGGLASLLIAIAEHIKTMYNQVTVIDPVNGFSLGLTIIVGGVTFTGSMIAWAKLSGKMDGKAIHFPYQNQINGLIILVGIVLSIMYVTVPVSASSLCVYTVVILSLILGVTFVIPIGGGDMPVIISFLNSLSGIAAAMVGFTINNVVLIVAGCLVGASGVILTIIMCKAMNKKLVKLLFAKPVKAGASKAGGVQREPASVSAEDAYLMLEAATQVVFIPGYGMAVAQAQHAVKDLTNALEANGCEVNFAIHPVAGRMPGHMNVLLAESDIDYDKLKTMDEMNPLMSTQDIAIVIGANDVVNPAAENDESSPIYGMPIIKAYEARNVFVLKRGKGTGYSGIENELFTNENTLMIYGDAKATVSALVNEFNS